MLKLPKISEYIDMLQSQGRYTVCKDEISKVMMISPDALKIALLRLVQKKRIACPRRGFYVIVPLEYRIKDAPPVSWFIDDLMKYLGSPYYVGLLSAAELHGAAHQKPQEFQVISKKPLREIRMRGLRIRFIKKRNMEKTPVMNVQTETGSMCVSTLEATSFDLIRYMDMAGSLSNVATVLAELAESLNPEKLLVAAQIDIELSSIQRLGYLIESLGFKQLVAPLWEWTSHQRLYPVLLKPGHRDAKSFKDARWSVIVNEQVELDI